MTAKKSVGAGGDSPLSTPDLVPTTPNIRPPDHNWTLQLVMELQMSTGKLIQAVETLAKQSDEQGKKLDTISHKIFAATWVLLVLGAILSFLLSHLWGEIAKAVAKLATLPSP